MTSNRVGVIGPWPNMKALIASDQKKEADMSIGSFLTTSDRDKFRHWLISYCSQSTLKEFSTQQNQFLHLGVTLGQDLKAWDQSRFILDDLKWILLVSRLILFVGSGFPIGPRHIMMDWFSRGIIKLFLRFWRRKSGNENASEKSKEKVGVMIWKEKGRMYLWDLRDGRHCWSRWLLNPRSSNPRCASAAVLKMAAEHMCSWTRGETKRCYRKSVDEGEGGDIYSLCSKGNMGIWCAAYLKDRDLFERWQS